VQRAKEKEEKKKKLGVHTRIQEESDNGVDGVVDELTNVPSSLRGFGKEPTSFSLFPF